MEDPSYAAGRQAYEYGCPLSDNPYEALSADWHDWQRGWCDAQEDDFEDFHPGIV
ncbi:hypothetical protein [Trinickia dinghuensis]|uniref:hypothetical protein n=1 Tax=Trinickia dinghuensis TaxID=2291023 RepID=UPI0015F131CC|nr:hypothetical protein [Trinickia dinghuensis]